jgi:hypothetical protein
MEGMGSRMGQLEAIANSGHQRTQRLEDNALASPQPQALPPAPEISDIQLDEMVVEGKITPEQRANYQSLQRDQKLRGDLSQELDLREDRRSQQQAQVDIIAQYKQHMPELMTEGSESRVRLGQEMANLQRLDGHPKNSLEHLRMERQALRNAFGPPEGLRQIQEFPNPAGANRETGGGLDPSQGARDAGGIGVKLDASQKSYYEGMIRDGFYKNWDEVAKLEAEYGPNGSKRRTVVHH